MNVDSRDGVLRAEVLEANGKTVEPFTLRNCQPLNTDSVLRQVTWNGGSDLSCLKGKITRLRFEFTNGSLYVFWVSPDLSGASHGYTAAGGPGFTGPVDTVGVATKKVAKALPAP
ncbi:MAG: hypothetical protein JXQ73_13355 [Phycisphaerae bacterium]|nr:hypothetical protein [Phycisphaerae bacterium]